MRHANVTKKVEISAAHWLPKHYGKCQHLHGHNYVFEVTVAAAVGEATGMVLDFSDLKHAIQDTIGEWDHTLLTPYTIDDLAKFLALCELNQHHWLGLHNTEKIICLGMDSTAENLSFIACQLLREKLREMNILIGWVSVQVWETSNSSAMSTLALT